MTESEDVFKAPIKRNTLSLARQKIFCLMLPFTHLSKITIESFRLLAICAVRFLIIQSHHNQLSSSKRVTVGSFLRAL